MGFEQKKRFGGVLAITLAALQGLAACGGAQGETDPGEEQIEITNGSLAAPGTEPTPSAADVRIVQAISNGNGCRVGVADATVALGTDLRSLKLTLTQPLTVQGGSATTTYSQCTFTVDLVVSAGWSYAFDDGQLQGQTALAQGSSVTSSLSYWFPFTAGTPIIRKQISGPSSGAYSVSGPFSPVNWSSCQTSTRFSAKANIALTGSSASQASIDSIGDIRMRWRRCP